MNMDELTQKYIVLDERVTRHTEQIKTCFSQINDLKSLAESVKDLAVSVQLMAHEQKDLGHKVDNLATDLEEIKEKPGKRWEGAVKTVVTTVVAAVVAYMLGKFGL